MADIKTNRKRTNRIFKSLHKPLTYLGVERTLSFFIVNVVVRSSSESLYVSPDWPSAEAFAKERVTRFQ